MQGQCKLHILIYGASFTQLFTRSANHFNKFAPEDIPYAKKREYNRPCIDI